ncbi:MAG: hypothetical protein AB1349_09750 [Elusimicrobiota bacterium]
MKDPITNIEIKIDGGTLAEATLFSVRKVENKNVSKCLQTILSYEFKSDKKFDKPVKITIPYTAQDVNGLNENNLKIAYLLNETTNDYEVLESEVDTDAKTVSANVLHFSIYAIVYQQPQMTPEPDTTFRKGEIYACPNPAKRGVFPKIHIEVGLADKIEIKMYNIAGELVQSTELYSSDVKSDATKYYYEYPWDISNVASGIYVSTIEAKKSGFPDIKTTRKMAVIK